MNKNDTHIADTGNMANEKRLIDPNDVYKLFDERGLANLHVGDIDEIQRVDAVEVVHGYWKGTAYVGVSRCSCCDKPSSTPDCLNAFHDYCPNCGAKMDGEKENPK